MEGEGEKAFKSCLKAFHRPVNDLEMGFKGPLKQALHACLSLVKKGTIGASGSGPPSFPLVLAGVEIIRIRHECCASVVMLRAYHTYYGGLLWLTLGGRTLRRGLESLFRDSDVLQIPSKHLKHNANTLT